MHLRNNLVLTLFLSLLMAAISHAQDFSTAKSKADAYYAAKKAVADATAQNQPDQAAMKQKEAQSLLQEGLIAYKDAGVESSAEPAVLLEYVGLQEEAGDYDLAAETLATIVQADPNNAIALTRQGENYAKCGPAKRKEAFKALHAALAIDSTSSQAARTHFLLGDWYWQEGLFEFAGDHFDAALKLNPDDVPARIARAALNARNGQVIEASKEIDDLSKAAQPYDIDTRERLRKALADFDAARRYFPDTAENHAAYARLLYRAARVTDAILAAQRATRLNPQDTAMWNFLASMHMQMGNLSQAKAAFEKSLEAKPDQPDVRDTLSKLDAQLQQQTQPQPAKPAVAPRAPMIIR
ncbi:MAG TPA: tetratricopeptide repeat protein [Candidatus Hydrogenedentes bacterium]|nr:tetratricopeptide repeat protein [Candidatus Hydrogenedentota bacterium]